MLVHVNEHSTYTRLLKDFSPRSFVHVSKDNSAEATRCQASVSVIPHAACITSRRPVRDLPHA